MSDIVYIQTGTIAIGHLGRNVLIVRMEDEVVLRLDQRNQSYRRHVVNFHNYKISENIEVFLHLLVLSFNFLYIGIMSTLHIFPNPTKRDIDSFLKKHPKLNEDIVTKIQNNNVRVEFSKHEKYIFLVFYIPEYIQKTRSIATIELNVFFDRVTNEVTIFAFNTNHFFKRYGKQVESIRTVSLSKFLEDILSIILDDEAKIIDHILQDTREVKEEYHNSKDSSLLIRHLTNNLTNITTLTLICDNQDRILDEAEDYIRHYEDSPISYQRNYIHEELEFAKEFCQTLMKSINTKYQVRMSDTLYAYTRFTFVIFLAGAVFQIVYAFHNDPTPAKITFWFASLIVFLGTLVMFRRF